MILICDDEGKKLRSCADVLELLEYEVELITGSVDALNFLSERSGSVDAILLDVRIPDGGLVSFLREQDLFQVDETEHTGILLFRYIRERFDLPVVIYSVLREDDVRCFFREMGVTVLQKPTPVLEIVRALEDAMGG